MTASLGPELLALLQAVDTPTVCNAIELVEGRRKATGFTRGQVVCAWPDMPSMVGYARTATIRSDRPSTEAPQIVREQRLAYYDHVAAGEGPRLAVLQDVGEARGLGAFWGEVNVAIHKGLGLAGVLTDGAIRDLGAVERGFQMIGGSVSPSHAFVHVESFGAPVEVFGLSVATGDLIHADRHGAALIPAGMEAELAKAIDLVIRKEAPILRAARAPGFDTARLRQAWGEAEDVH